MLDEPSPESRLTVIPVPAAPPPAEGAHDLIPDDVAPQPSWSRQTLYLATQGSEEAWRTLVDTYGQMLWRAIRELGLDGSDAAAVWQHAWLSLAQRSGEALRHGDVARWLLVTVVGEASRVRLRGWVPEMPHPRRPNITLVEPAGCDVGS